MRNAFVAISRTVFNVLYRMQSKHERCDQVVFLSRQANEPSYDFTELAREFEARGWQTTMHLKKVTKRNLIAYTWHALKEVTLLAHCKAVILDRFDPIVSLIDFEYEKQPEAGTRAETAALHDEFPASPVIVQLWHAFGAFKKFGYQSVGTREGHSAKVTEAFNIHRNYSWVICSGESVRKAFAEAFAYPLDRVIALVRPEFDELVAKRAELGKVASRVQAEGDAHLPSLLLAPTLRKSKNSAHPFRELFQHATDFEQQLKTACNQQPVTVTWAFHPLEEGLPAPGNASEALMSCDMVVTDYSSIAYEAYLLGKLVVFYIPDIDEYSQSPGLNANPQALCPGMCAMDSEELLALMSRFLCDPSSYPHEQLDTFAASAFDRPDDTQDSKGEQPSAASRIVDFTLAHIR